MVGVAAATAMIGVVQTWLSTAVGQRVMHDLRTGLFDRLQRQSVGFFTQARGGEVQSRLTNDINGVQNVVTSTATSIASNVTVVVGTAVAMGLLSWRLSLLSLLVLPPAIWLTRRVARLRHKITAERQRRLADLNVQIEETLSVSGALLTRTLGAASRMSDRFTATSHDLVDLQIRSMLAGRWRMATMTVVFAAIPAAIYLVAGLPATSGGMTIGTLVAFTALQATLFRPLMGLLNVGVDVTASLALFSRIFEYQDLPIDIDDPADPVEITHVRGDVTLERVGFAYDAASGPVLSDIDLHVPAGTSLALVGETGSGKTTLAGLVARLHDPTTGRVLVDGVDVRDLRLADLARVVGVVSQDTYLLHASVRDNLRHARPDATDAEIEDALPRRPDPRRARRPSRRLRHRGRGPRAPVLRRREAAARHRADPAARPARARARRGHQRPGQRDRAGRPGRPRPGSPPAGPRSPSPTGCPRSVTPTRSRSSTTAASSSSARTTSCSPTAAGTPPCWAGASWPRPPRRRCGRRRSGGTAGGRRRARG